MARRTLQIVLTTTLNNGAHYLNNGCEQVIQVVDTMWHLTYKGKLAKIRQEHYKGYKYLRSCWSTKQTAITRLNKLRKIYDSNHFGIIEIKT